MLKLLPKILNSYSHISTVVKRQQFYKYVKWYGRVHLQIMRLEPTCVFFTTSLTACDVYPKELQFKALCCGFAPSDLSRGAN